MRIHARGLYRSCVCVVLTAIILVLSACSAGSVKKATASSLKQHGVIIDAGHGGFDVGAVSTQTGEHEDVLNLAIAYALAEILEDNGIPFTFTRSDSNAIAETKEEDMAKRLELIHESDAAIMVSIHMNSFPDDAAVHGPQIFYRGSNHENIELAKSIQEELNSFTGGTRQIAEDQLYVLSKNTMPSVLVECGFLSNPEESELLSDADYQINIATAIFNGICDYCDYSL